MSKIDARWHYVALVFVVFAAGFWPYRDILGNYPEGADALKWVTNAAPSSDGWFEWVVAKRHFIGYRPVTAASFTVNNVISGWSPYGYRLTNAALHLAAGIGVYGLFRVLTRGKGWWAVLAAAIFFTHPAGETVLPHMARRSYLLGSLFSVATLIAWTVATRDRKHIFSGSMVAAGLCLGAALLSNEVAYVVVPMLPIFAFVFRDRKKAWYDPVVRTAPLIGIAICAIELRFAVLGHFGGYRKRYFAFTRNNHNMLREVDDTPYQMVIEAAWRYMCFPTAASGDQALLLLGGSAGLIVAIAVVVYYAWRSIAEPMLPNKEPEQRLVLMMFIWLAGHTLLYALSRNWFWRQSYPMLAPFALLVAMVARDTWIRRDTAVKRLLHFIPQGVLAASILYHAPVISGVDQDALRGQIKASKIVREVKANLSKEEFGPSSLVYIALPVRGPAIRDAITWIRREYKPRGILIRWLAILRPNSKEKAGRPLLDLKDVDGRMLIELRPHMDFDGKLQKSLRLQGKTVLWMDRLNIPEAEQSYVYYTKGVQYHLVEVPTEMGSGAEPVLQPKKRSKRKKKKRNREDAQPKKKGEGPDDPGDQEH